MSDMRQPAPPQADAQSTFEAFRVDRVIVPCAGGALPVAPELSALAPEYLEGARYEKAERTIRQEEP